MKRNKNTTPTPTCPILYSRIGLKHFAIVKDDRFFFFYVIVLWALLVLYA